MAFMDHINELLSRVGLNPNREAPPVVAVLNLRGVIGVGGLARRGLSFAGIEPLVKKAFSKRVRAVALVVNSPGGSPVQSAQIAGLIRHYSQEKKIPVFAFAEDVAASGGYWLMLAADEIYADAMSVVGSIGVIAAGFGFNEAIAKLGIERRVHTQGDNKSFLDPFKPENPDDVKRLKDIQADIHKQFIAAVKQRRGERLSSDDAVLFNGDIWTGERAMSLGLVDGIGDIRTIMRRKYGADVKLVPLERPMNWLQKRLGRMPVSLAADDTAAGGWATDLIAAVEERAMWSRFGL